MNLLKPATKRHFTDAARAAAADARRRKRDLAIPKDIAEVFVVRRSATRSGFGWEIRRFGAIVLESSLSAYPTAKDARAAGDDALAASRTDA